MQTERAGASWTQQLLQALFASLLHNHSLKNGSSLKTGQEYGDKKLKSDQTDECKSIGGLNRGLQVHTQIEGCGHAALCSNIT